MTDKDGIPYKTLTEVPSKFSNLNPVSELRWLAKEIFTEAQNHKCENLQTYAEHLEWCTERVVEKKDHKDERLERSEEERRYRLEEERKRQAYLLSKQQQAEKDTELEKVQESKEKPKKDKKEKTVEKSKKKKKEKTAEAQKVGTLKRKFKEIQEKKKKEPRVVLTERKKNYNVHYAGDVSFPTGLSRVQLGSLCQTIDEVAGEMGLNKWTDRKDNQGDKTFTHDGKTFEMKQCVGVIAPDIGDFRATAGMEDKVFHVYSQREDGKLKVISNKFCLKIVEDRMRELCSIYQKLVKGKNASNVSPGLEGVMSWLRLPPWYKDSNGKVEKEMPLRDILHPLAMEERRAQAANILGTIWDTNDPCRVRAEIMRMIITKYRVETEAEVDEHLRTWLDLPQASTGRAAGSGGPAEARDVDGFEAVNIATDDEEEAPVFVPKMK